MARTSSPAPRASGSSADGDAAAARTGEAAADKQAAASKSAAAAFVYPPRPAGLRGGLLGTYGLLVLGFLFFVFVCESMKKPVPEGKFQMKDGGPLIDILDFDPVELGPYPKCHPHFEHHEVVAEDGSKSWVKNSDAPKGGPYPVGHPENPEWVKKSDEEVRKKNYETRFTWEGLQPGLHLLTLATLVVIIASRHSVWLFTEPEAEKREATQVLQSEDAYWFPVMASCALFGLFIVLKYLGADWIKTAISCVVVFACAVSFGNSCERLVALARNQTSKPLFRIPYLDESVTLTELVGSLIGVAMGVGYILTKNWIINNIFGIAFCITGITSVGLSSFKTGSIMLVGLFFYDVFWVFGSKSVFGSNVMVHVATGLEAPIKLMFPRALGGCGNLQSSMLGLGDIAVPGIFIAFMAKWDAVKIGEKASKSFVYLNCIMVAYVLSLITTLAIMLFFNAAQPALLYIVPYILIASVGCALARGELKALWAFSIPDEESGKEDGKAAGAEAKKDQ